MSNGYDMLGKDSSKDMLKTRKDFDTFDEFFDDEPTGEENDEQYSSAEDEDNYDNDNDAEVELNKPIPNNIMQRQYAYDIDDEMASKNLQQLYNTSTPMEGVSRQKATGYTEQGGVELSDINVRVSCTIAELNLSIQELQNLTIGSYLSIANILPTVKLVTNGRTFADGLLVEIDGRIGVKIIGLGS